MKTYQQLLFDLKRLFKTLFKKQLTTVNNLKTVCFVDKSNTGFLLITTLFIGITILKIRQTKLAYLISVLDYNFIPYKL